MLLKASKIISFNQNIKCDIIFLCIYLPLYEFIYSSLSHSTLHSIIHIFIFRLCAECFWGMGLTDHCKVNNFRTYSRISLKLDRTVWRKYFGDLATEFPDGQTAPALLDILFAYLASLAASGHSC